MINSNQEILLTAMIFTYNHVGRIAKCIESHINQKTTYPYKIQIWDDCSIDGTTKICKEYADKYPDKIELITQEENTFLKPYNETQSYKAIQQINTKYFCIIDGDDQWCDENKIQIALDILENNPEYVGFAHDTLHVNKNINVSQSYVHDVHKWDVQENPVYMNGAKPFFYTSSRVFRNVGFKEKQIWPVDFILYFYHFAKGPIYYYDKIMAHYNVGEYNTFSDQGEKVEGILQSMFAYKLAKAFDFKQDDLCMDVQKYYNSFHPNTKHHYPMLVLFKRLFGVTWGWHIWFYINFVPKYGLECLNPNWIYPRRKVKHKANNRNVKRIKNKKKLEKKLKRQEKWSFFYEKLLPYSDLFNNKLEFILMESLERKYERIEKLQNDISELNCQILEYRKSKLKSKMDIKK